MQEHKGGKGTKLSLKKGGKMATGGVVNGQGGFATGGVVNGQGGFATGGVAKSNAGGYKKGGAPKKAYAAGGTVNSGRAVAMPQGNKKPSQPVKTNLVAGTFKRGGKVRKMADGGDLIDYDALINPPKPTIKSYEEIDGRPYSEQMPNFDFSQDPSFQAGPQANYPAAINYLPADQPTNEINYPPADPPRQFNVDPPRQFNVDPPRQFNVDPPRQFNVDPPRNPDGSSPSMPEDGRPPMPVRVNDTGFLPPGPERDFYRGLISREEMDSRLASTPYKAGGKVAPIKRMTGGRSVKC